MGLFKKRKQRLAAEREAREKQELARRIREQAKEQADQWLRIASDCAELVNTTKNPEVFFMRYDLMLETLAKLAGLECTGIFANSRELPSVAHQRVSAQFPAATNTFLDRSFDDAKAKAATLKTEKGRINAIDRYFEKMEEHIVYMDAESIDYLETLKRKHHTNEEES